MRKLRKILAWLDTEVGYNFYDMTDIPLTFELSEVNGALLNSSGNTDELDDKLEELDNVVSGLIPINLESPLEYATIIQAGIAL
jgi:hypothetical protein